VRSLAPLAYALKRIAHNLALAGCVLAGLAASVALSICIPLYSNAVNTRMLGEELARQPLPPFAFLVSFNGPLGAADELEAFRRLERTIAESAPRSVGLPLLSAVTRISVERMQLLALPGSAYTDTTQPLEWMSFGSFTDLAPHILMLEGRFPRPRGPGQPFEVILARDEAEKLGFEVGEAFVLSIDRDEAGSRQRLAVPVRVVGVWQPADADRSYWFLQPAAFSSMCLTDEASFWEAVTSTTGDVPVDATWYLVFDGSSFRIDDTSRILQDISRVKGELASFASRPSIIYSPEESLKKYRAASSQLTIHLFAFALPVFALVLYLIVLLSHLTVERRKNEIALLRSRGTSRRRVLSTQLLESLVLVAGAIPLGVFLGMLFARAMERTRTFLRFVARPPTTTSLSLLALGIALAAAALALSGTIVPAIAASRDTIVSYKRERARTRRRPLWQRFYLDAALFAVAAYGTFTLRSRGTLMNLVSGGAVDDPFKNPLLFFVPTLFLLAASLVVLRFFPALMEGLARLFRRTRGAPLVLAVRSIARSPAAHHGLLLLVMLTLGLAGYTASMARTLDLHLVSDVYYAVGADIVLREQGVFVPDDSAAADPTSAAAERWEYPPLSDYTDLPGVLDATRVGAYEAEIRWTGKRIAGRVVGIERASFRDVAFYRSDFSHHSLESLLAALALDDAAVLVQGDFYRENQLAIGQRIPLFVTLHGSAREMEFVVAGTLDQFPTAYAEDGPFFVANLPHLFYRSGGEDLHDVWLKTEPGLTGESLQATLIDRRLTGSVTADARSEIRLREGRADRQGMFGLLSIGFLASAFVTALGFLVQSIMSYRARSVELGILRAIGLPLRQMIGSVLGEQVWLAASGAVAGTFLACLSSVMFIPFLQAGAGTHAGTPPMIVAIGWRDFSLVLAIFAGMLVAAIVLVVVSLLRMKIFQAIKLDEVS
jgi:putative ABC transport system permease protein